MHKQKGTQGKRMNTEEAVLELLKSGLKGETCKGIDVENWEAVFEESKKQSVQMLAFFALGDGQTPPEVYNRWKNAVYQGMTLNIQNQAAHAALTRLLLEHGIAFVTLKGAISSRYYLMPDYRMMGDVDFYVAPGDFKKCHRLMLENGFTFHTQDRDHDWSYYKNKIHYEMHFALPGIPEGKDGEEVRDLLASLVADARMVDLSYGEVKAPSDFHHGLILLLHTASHLFGGGIGLRHLCDWAVFAGHFSDSEFRELFEAKLKKAGLWRFAQILTNVCIRYLGMEERQWAELEIDGRVIDQLAGEILKKGNFGNKAGDDLSGMLVANGFSAKVGERPNVVQLLASASTITKQHWPAARKVKILLPFGWVFFGGRYFVRSMLGKRKKLDYRKMSKEATKRKELYRQFGLFQ